MSDMFIARFTYRDRTKGIVTGKRNVSSYTPRTEHLTAFPTVELK